ncbi:MAG TPA: IPT/TIG domain-containing protein [Balneolales bacterium]|nr:IPT/TIG domain-containing protein [Balneolales bacterium]
MKSNFTKMASLFVLALSIILSGCKNGGGSKITGSSNNGGPVSITSITPTAGPAGTELTIKGENFSTNTSENTVTFAGNKTASVTSASATQLKVKVPDGAMTGAISVKVGTESVKSDHEFAVAPQVYADLPGNKTLITRDETWANDTTLAGPHYILPGVTLTVKEGVTVKFKYHNNNADEVGTLIALPGTWDAYKDGFHPSGRLVAKGLANNPVIFTSAKSTPQVGDWGGIILCGNAVNNWPGGQGEIEGLSKAVQYGVNTNKHNFINDDDSGVLSYVQINYTGYSIADGSELQALTPYSLGSKTQIDHISIFKSLDDGIEPFGGTVNFKYMVVIGAQDDGFDGDAGWRGHGQFYLAVETGPANRGMENDGCASGSYDATCQSVGPSQFHVYNATVYSKVGGQTNGEIPMSGMMLREGLSGHYGNVILANLSNKLTTAPIYLENDQTRKFLKSGDLSFGGNIAYQDGDYSAAFDTLGYTAQDLDLLKVNSSTQLFTDASNYDFSLVAGSPATTHYEQVPGDPFYTQTNFSGAVGVKGSANDWTTGATWIKWQD